MKNQLIENSDRPAEPVEPGDLGQTVMATAVGRQQTMLARELAENTLDIEEARSKRLNRYLELLGLKLLGSETKPADEDVGEFNKPAQEFHIPRGIEEAARISRAGGSTYGV